MGRKVVGRGSFSYNVSIKTALKIIPVEIKAGIYSVDGFLSTNLLFQPEYDLHTYLNLLSNFPLSNFPIIKIGRMYCFSAWLYKA